MKRKHSCLYILLFIAILIIGYLFLFNSGVGSQPIIDIESLMIDAQTLPAGWKLKYAEPIVGRDDWGERNLSKVFVLDTEKGVCHQYLYKFNNIFEAMYAYYFLKKELPIHKEQYVEYLIYKNDLANDWFLECGEIGAVGISCDVIGRYSDFISYFHIVVNKENFSPQELEEILIEIDGKFRPVIVQRD